MECGKKLNKSEISTILTLKQEKYSATKILLVTIEKIRVIN